MKSIGSDACVKFHKKVLSKYKGYTHPTHTQTIVRELESITDIAHRLRDWEKAEFYMHHLNLDSSRAWPFFASLAAELVEPPLSLTLCGMLNIAIHNKYGDRFSAFEQINIINHINDSPEHNAS